MFDTHCHLNFSAFDENREAVIHTAFQNNIGLIVIPGTDPKSSQKAVEIAEKYEGIYAAVGIHPHHLFEFHGKGDEEKHMSSSLDELIPFISSKKVVAIGEVGVDRHLYKQTNYTAYQIDEEFMKLQRIALEKQIHLSFLYSKSLIVHNREAKRDLLEILHRKWDSKLKKRMVIHCCEPDIELLDFVIAHDIFLGVDGDVTFSKKKQEFIAKVPLEHLVLETDSPFLVPEPLKSEKKFPNTPSSILLIAAQVAELQNKSIEEIGKITEENGRILFNL